ncbi:hypothetical protein WT00_04690 [Burkholderia territorii]|nr:hypothetical protein WT00_04690 [Burkholderia territorii]
MTSQKRLVLFLILLKEYVDVKKTKFPRIPDFAFWRAFFLAKRGGTRRSERSLYSREIGT